MPDNDPQARLDQLDRQGRDLTERFDAGELSAAEYREALAPIDDARTAISRQIDRADIERDMAQSRFVNVSAKRFLKQHSQYHNEVAITALDAEVQGGGNDLLAAGLDVATIETNLRTIYDNITGLGAKIVAITVTPQNGQREADRLSINDWIKTQPDVDAVDTDAYLTDPATMLQADGVHPNALGAQVIGQPTGLALANLIAPAELLYDPTQPAPAENLMVNPFFLGANPIATGTIADDWSHFANTNGLTSTLSKTTLDGSEAQQITLTGTATAAAENLFKQFVTPPNSNIGDVYEAWIEIEATSLQGITGIKWQVTRGSSNPAIFSISAQIDGSNLSVPFKGVLRSPPFALTAAGQRLEPAFAIKPAVAAVDATVILTRAGLRKV